MPSDLSPYLGNKVIRYLQGNAMPTPPTGLWVALFNGNPKTSGTEVGANVKAAGPRQQLTSGAVASGTAHLLTSNAAGDWGASENAVTFTHVGIFDANAGGNLLFSKIANGSPISILAGSTVKFNSGAIQINVGADT